MLQIRLSKVPSVEGPGGLNPLPVETVTVACPDHLVLADLPVAKGIGAATATSVIKTVGRRSRRQLGERVHFCVQCDFPIATYGRLSPCEHAFCLECARSDSICYLCDERIQKIQTIKMMEGIFICAAPHCLKSFLKKADFESHIQESHGDLLRPNAEKEDGNESDAQSVRQSIASESTVRGPTRSVFSPSSNSQLQDREDKSRRQQAREPTPSRPPLQLKPPFFGQIQNQPLDAQSSGGIQHHFHQQGYDTQGAPQEPGQFSDRQQLVSSENPFHDYQSMQSGQPPNFAVPVNPNTVMNPPVPFGYPPYTGDGAQPFSAAPYEMVRLDKTSDAGGEQSSLLGFPPGPASGSNFPAPYPPNWNPGMSGAPFEHNMPGQGFGDGFATPSDPHGKVMFQQGDYGRNPPGFALHPPPFANKSMEQTQSGNPMDPRDAQGILAPQNLPLPPPPPPHLPQMKQQFYPSDLGRDGQGFGWQHERDSFRSGQD